MLSFVTIAEGVETVVKRDFLLAYGCDEVQGYLFSRPVGADELATFVRGLLIEHKSVVALT